MEKGAKTALIGVAIGCAAFVVLIVIIVVAVVLPAIPRAREEARKLNCKSNLRQIGISMVTYVDNFGDGRYYPYDKAGGVATLSLLYDRRIRLLTDPRGFICTQTADPLCTTTTLTRRTCSYIGRSPKIGPLSDSAESDTRVAGDDSYRSEGNNHEGGTNILFLDGHVEFITASGNPTSLPLSATSE